MRKTLTAIVAAAIMTAGIVTTPTKAEARCLGCWVGAGVAAGFIGGAIVANNAYYYGGYRYAPAYYGYGYGYGYGYPAPVYYTYRRPAYYSYAPAYYAPRYPAYYAPRYYAPRRYVGYAPYYRGYYGARRGYVRYY